MDKENMPNIVAIVVIGLIALVALISMLFTSVEVAREMPTIVAGCVGALGGFLGSYALTSLRSGPTGTPPPPGQGRRE